jgi:hypothetical protein
MPYLRKFDFNDCLPPSRADRLSIFNYVAEHFSISGHTPFFSLNVPNAYENGFFANWHFTFIFIAEYFPIFGHAPFFSLNAPNAFTN